MALQAGEVYAIGGVDLSKAFKGLDDLMKATTKSMSMLEKNVNDSLSKMEKNVGASGGRLGKAFKNALLKEIQTGFSASEKQWKTSTDKMVNSADSMTSRIHTKFKDMRSKTKNEVEGMANDVKSALSKAGNVKIGGASKSNIIGGSNMNNAKLYQDQMYELEYTSRHMYLAIAQPLMRLGGDMLQLSRDYETTMLTIQGMTKATAEEMVGFEKAVKSASEATKETLASTATAALILGKAGYDLEDISKALPEMLRFSAVSAMDMEEATGLVVSVLKTYNMEMSEAGRVTDLMVGYANKAVLDVQDLSSSLRYAMQNAAALKVPFEEVMAVLANLSEAGIKGTMAGTALRNMFTRLVAPTDEAKAILNELGLKLTDVNGKFVGMQSVFVQLKEALADGRTDVERLATIFEITGARALPSMIKMIDTGSTSFKTFLEAANDTNGAVKTLYDTMYSGQAGVMKEFAQSMEKISIAVVKSGLGEDVKKLSQSFSEWTDKMKETNPELLKMYTRAGEVTIILTSVLFYTALVVMSIGKIWGAMAPAIGKLVGLIKTAAIAIGGFATALVATIGALLYYIFAPDDVGAVIHREEGLFRMIQGVLEDWAPGLKQEFLNTGMSWGDALMWGLLPVIKALDVFFNWIDDKIKAYQQYQSNHGKTVELSIGQSKVPGYTKGHQIADRYDVNKENYAKDHLGDTMNSNYTTDELNQRAEDAFIHGDQKTLDEISAIVAAKATGSSAPVDLFSGSGSGAGGGGGGVSASIDKSIAAYQKMYDRIAQLTLSDYNYKLYLLNKQVADYEEAGVKKADIEKWFTMEVKSLDKEMFEKLSKEAQGYGEKLGKTLAEARKKELEATKVWVEEIVSDLERIAEFDSYWQIEALKKSQEIMSAAIDSRYNAMIAEAEGTVRRLEYSLKKLEDQFKFEDDQKMFKDWSERFAKAGEDATKTIEELNLKTAENVDDLYEEEIKLNADKNKAILEEEKDFAKKKEDIARSSADNALKWRKWEEENLERKPGLQRDFLPDYRIKELMEMELPLNPVTGLVDVDKLQSEIKWRMDPGANVSQEAMDELIEMILDLRDLNKSKEEAEAKHNDTMLQIDTEYNTGIQLILDERKKIWENYYKDLEEIIKRREESQKDVMGEQSGWSDQQTRDQLTGSVLAEMKSLADQIPTWEFLRDTMKELLSGNTEDQIAKVEENTKKFLDSLGLNKEQMLKILEKMSEDGEIAKSVQELLSMSPDQLEEYVERWNPVLDSAEEIGKNWVQRLVDGLEDRIPALEATVARIKALLNRIASLNSAVSASGANTENGGTSSSDDSHFANGGLVTHPTRAMLGEAGAELVVPLTKGFGNPPAGGNGFGIGNSVNNNFNIYTQKPLDPKEVRRQIERSSYLAGSRI